MASPTRPPPPAAPSQHPAVDPSRDKPLSPENLTPPPPPPGPTTTSPQHRSGDYSPASPPQPPMPPPPPPPPPPPATADPSPPLLREDHASPRRSPSPPVPASPPPPPPPPPPAPASSEARSEQEAAESASESGSMTLALALTQTEESVPPTPPKPSSAEASPTGSPRKESALTIAKLLSGEDLAAADGKPAADKLAPASDPGPVPAAAAAAAASGGGGVGSKRWLLGGGIPEKVRRAELRRAELGFRVSAAVFCLVSLSVMAADTTPGWSGDSFRRYNEYRYTLAASVVAFTYSGFQLVAEVHCLVTGRRIIRAPWRGYFNLAMDQMLAYLLLSASSAALSRNDVWVSRFGGDQFTKLVNASASMAFLAFISLGLSSIISAYCVFSSVS